MDKKAAIKTMNDLGSTKQPFLFVISYDTNNNCIWPLNEVPDNVLYSIENFSNTHRDKLKPNKNFRLKTNKIPLLQYKKAFDEVQHHLQQGNTFLTNLTFKTEIETNISLKDIFLQSKAPYKLLFNNNFVVFSPESFISVSGNHISTFPMKGTIDASVKNAKEIILNNKKEAAEHATIVDLLRNDLSSVAKNVKVMRYRYFNEIQTQNKTLLQVSSEIAGELELNWQEQIGNILFSMLPAGSICGAPKPKTLEIIKEVENYNRGFYTGVFGIFTGDSLKSAVMIRFIEKEDSKLFYKSGGGITSMSYLDDEYVELNNKIYVPVVRSSQS